MDRLTSRQTMIHADGTSHVVTYCHGHRWGPAAFPQKYGASDPKEYKEYCEMVDRLAAYEDTGLTPDEIGRMRWIPVIERLPDKEQWCHIAIKTKHGYRVENDLFAIETADQFGRDHGFCKRKEKITHWMPYPEPPKEENDAEH